jgi:uncharacterized membrane protein
VIRASAATVEAETVAQRAEGFMQLIAAYIAALVVFGLVDATWLSTMGAALYRPALGDILLSNVKVGPAIAFYAMFPVGIVVFAVMPALRSGVIGPAVMNGLLFGAIAYGTYDLTNFATLRNWNLQITVIDIVYGAIASALAGALATLLVRSLPWFAGPAS